MLSDKFKSLIGHILQCLADIFNIQLVSTSGYRPESNGSLERTHLGLVEYLRQFLDGKDDWDQLLELAMFSYNTCTHESTGFSPFELIYGHRARVPSALPKDTQTYPTYLSELIQRLDDTRSLASESLIRSKHRSKTYYDRNAKTSTYTVGQEVYVIKDVRKNKLEKHYSGPYKIIEIPNEKIVIIKIDGKRVLKHVDKIKPAYKKVSLSDPNLSLSSESEPYDSDSTTSQ